MPGFSDVLGHEQTIAHMKSAIEANKVSHAYLLAGEKDQARRCWPVYLPERCSVKPMDLNHVGNVTPAYRQRAAISRTLSM